MPEKRPNRRLGALDQVFWEYCNRGEFRLQTCRPCGRVFWPPVPICDTCGTWDLEWAPMSGRGKLISHCTFERRYYEELPLPWDCILVELEEGPLFVSNPKGFTRLDMANELPVRVAFIDCEDQSGAFKLPVFERA
jgi:uncharacterized OB-fold protein